MTLTCIHTGPKNYHYASLLFFSLSPSLYITWVHHQTASNLCTQYSDHIKSLTISVIGLGDVYVQYVQKNIFFVQLQFMHWSVIVWWILYSLYVV